jgi:hypothetical protein
MNLNNSGKAKLVVIVVVLLIAAGLTGWWFGRSHNTSNNKQTDQAQSDNKKSDNVSSNNDVKALVSYVLPDGWKASTCAASAGSVFVVPKGTGNVNCNSTPSSPIKISVDPANNKDCNQLQNVQNVSKHICSSEFINGHKSLRAETVYNKDSSYKKDTTINAYYIDTGKGVIKLEYIHEPTNSENLIGFEQLAKSVQTKN